MGRTVGFQCCVRRPLESSGLGDGKDSGISVLCGGHTGNPHSPTPTESLGLGDGKDRGISMLCGGYTGNPHDSP